MGGGGTGRNLGLVCQQEFSALSFISNRSGMHLLLCVHTHMHEFQGLAIAKLVLCHLSPTSSPFAAILNMRSYNR
jgi:hypothetical protein